MSREGKVRGEEKIIYVERYLSGEMSMNQIATRCGIHKSSIEKWISLYKAFGSEGHISSSKNRSYPDFLKESAVTDYLSGKGSLHDICIKYKIRSFMQLHSWILKYNSHEKLKTSGTGGAPNMNKGRNTTYDERIEIVKFCIEKHNN